MLALACRATLIVLTLGVSLAPAQATSPPLWTPSSPIQNPPNEAKRVLGKILFWDEQLSSDNTMSCGTCHIPSAGGSDPRPAINPGFDGAFGTPDDVVGSKGVASLDAMDEYLRNEFFGLEPQVGGRVSSTNLMAMFSGSLFWDGRAEFSFVDPESGQELFQSGVGGLEIQALAPILNTSEMAHQGRTWTQVKDKLGGVRPLALASEIPSDMRDAVLAHPTYPGLFEDAFGDPEINAVRIAFALATYQRTLVPNQTPWDLWNDGDMSAMTPEQTEGLELFQESGCATCHAAPTFTNNDFMADGVRPSFEDRGRGEVTGNAFENGDFRTPSLRNVGLRPHLMHNGRFDLDQVFDFYAHRGPMTPFLADAHFLIQTPIAFDTATEDKIKHFLRTGLTDPRVENEEFPFDRPALYSEVVDFNPILFGSGVPGLDGHVPLMVALGVPNIGNDDFKIGITDTRNGASAFVAVSSTPPTGDLLDTSDLRGPFILSNDGAPMTGTGTFRYPIPNDPSLDGTTVYLQWLVSDPNAPDGFARSKVARLDFLCSMELPCFIHCVADFNNDGASDFFDLSAFLMALSNENDIADLNSDGEFDFFDVSAFLMAFGEGCP